MINTDRIVRLAVLTDTHGNGNAAAEALESTGPFDFFLHLGDGVEDGRRLAHDLGLNFMGVAGNEDFMSGEPERLAFEASGWRLFLIHGHQTDINPFQPRDVFEEHLDALAWMAGREEAEVLLFGHTHKAMVQKRNGLIIGNPGEMHPGSSQPPTFLEVLAAPEKLTINLMKKREKGVWTPERSENFSK